MFVDALKFIVKSLKFLGMGGTIIVGVVLYALFATENTEQSNATDVVKEEIEEAKEKIEKENKLTEEEAKEMATDFFNREQLKAQFNNPGYVESYFPQTESFWIFIKDPPKGEYAVNYARIVCNQAKNKYNVRGFTITIWGLSDKKKQGKFSCF